jgi:hypothetical protein
MGRDQTYDEGRRRSLAECPLPKTYRLQAGLD